MGGDVFGMYEQGLWTKRVLIPLSHSVHLIVGSESKHFSMVSGDPHARSCASWNIGRSRLHLQGYFYVVQVWDLFVSLGGSQDDGREFAVSATNGER